MFAPENAPFWLGFALGASVAALVCVVGRFLATPRDAGRDPYGEPWQ